jgi:ATP-dependent DNA helicase 2 subunit 2
MISWAALDGLIVALQAQDKFLNGKKTWTRKLVLVTDGENEMQTEGWKETAERMNEWGVITSIV